MDIKTIEQQVTTIRFFDDEVRHYINHPTDLVQALTRATGIVPSAIVLDTRPVKKPRKAKPAEKVVKHRAAQPRANWATAGHAGHTPRNKKADGDQPTFRCRKGCDRTFKKSGNRDNHEANCTGADEIGSYQPGAPADD